MGKTIARTFNAQMDSVRVTLPGDVSDAETDALMPAVAGVMTEGYALIREKLRAVDPRLGLEVFE